MVPSSSHIGAFVDYVSNFSIEIWYKTCNYLIIFYTKENFRIKKSIVSILSPIFFVSSQTKKTFDIGSIHWSWLIINRFDLLRIHRCLVLILCLVFFFIKNCIYLVWQTTYARYRVYDIMQNCKREWTNWCLQFPTTCWISSPYLDILWKSL